MIASRTSGYRSPDRRDKRSAEGEAAQRWFNTPRWRRLRQAQLRRQPFCVMCMDLGVYTPARVADHVNPHRGDPVAFWEGALQSLCKSHHSREKQCQENTRPLEVECDGWPIR